MDRFDDEPPDDEASERIEDRVESFLPPLPPPTPVVERKERTESLRGPNLSVVVAILFYRLGLC